jgi:hypothetical protein
VWGAGACGGGVNGVTWQRGLPREVPHFRAMDIDRFWDLIEKARATAGPAADEAVRDFDEPDDDPDRDYWDFEDLDLQAALSGVSGANGNGANGNGNGAKGNGADDGGTNGATVEGLDAAERVTGAEPFIPAGRRPADDDDAEVALGLHDEFEEDEDDEEDDDFDDEEDEITDPVAVALFDLLTELPAEEIAAFDNIFEEQRLRAENDDLANAATLIEHGFLGDESFDDFRAGLVALGRTTFEAVLADADSLADLPLVREIAGARDPRWLGREDLLFVASHAYSVVTGLDEVTFYDFAESLRSDDGGTDEAEDDDETDEWSVTDEAETRRRLPKLADMFYEKSMHNRKRAMDKLGLQE